MSKKPEKNATAQKTLPGMLPKAAFSAKGPFFVDFGDPAGSQNWFRDAPGTLQNRHGSFFALPRKTSQPPPGRPQGGPQASPGMPQGSPGVLFAWIFASILMSICIKDKTRPGGVRGAFELKSN